MNTVEQVLDEIKACVECGIFGKRKAAKMEAWVKANEQIVIQYAKSMRISDVADHISQIV
jgi:Zn ribbon nucleic-acid-binding protein